jgi:tetratricopeptide (TPR) repeat protein
VIPRLLVFLLACSLAFAQGPILMDGLSDHQHPVSTSNPEAQKFFNQGMRLIYAFNHDEAERAFRRAAELDPKMAMAWWGVAFAVGPNYNLPVDAAREKIAYDAVQKALALSAGGPEPERAYIEALAKRYSSDPNPNYPQLARDFVDAMRQLSQRYPDDLDAATLFAESLMNLRPWELWNKDGTPAPGTTEIVAVLESVMRRDPRHLGANHYYIHAVEASTSPDRALPAADRLGALAPAAGHLVHMPAHIYIRTGDYQATRLRNIDAARADETYLKTAPPNISGGIYALMYYSHNLHFIAAAAGMEGRYAEARSAADRLAAHIAPHAPAMPDVESFMSAPLVAELRFHRWNEVLKMPEPPAAWKITRMLWGYGRGMAFASTGKIADAERELQAVTEAERTTPPEMIFVAPFNNKTKNILRIARDVLAARIAAAKGDNASALKLLRAAAAVEDSLNYGEPPDWYFPVREALGGLLLRTGEAKQAEQVFREDLERNRRNPRSLFGLAESLKAQDKSYDAELVRRRFQAEWKNADTELKVSDL